MAEAREYRVHRFMGDVLVFDGVEDAARAATDEIVRLLEATTDGPVSTEDFNAYLEDVRRYLEALPAGKAVGLTVGTDQNGCRLALTVLVGRSA